MKRLGKYLIYTLGSILTLATVAIVGLFLYLEIAPPVSLDNQKARAVLERLFSNYDIEARQLQFHRSMSGWGIEINDVTISKGKNRLALKKAIIYPSWLSILRGNFYDEIRAITLMEGQIVLDSLWGFGNGNGNGSGLSHVRLEDILVFHRGVRVQINNLDFHNLTSGSGNFEILCRNKNIQGSIHKIDEDINVWFEPFDGNCFNQANLPNIPNIHWGEPLQININSRQRLELAGSQIAIIPQGFSTYNLDSLTLTASLEEDYSFQLEQLNAKSGEMKIQGSGFYKQDNSEINLVATNLNFADLPQLWHEKMQPSARWWVTTNIKKGLVTNAEINLKMAPTDSSMVAIKNIQGKLDFENLEVNYLDPMAMLKNAEGSAVFDDTSFNIHLKNGIIKDKITASGDVFMYDLESDIPKIKIATELKGDFAKILETLSSPPLNAGEYLAFEARQGATQGKLAMEFPLLESLALKDVSIKANGDITQASIKIDENELVIPQANWSATTNFVSIKGNARNGDRSAFNFELRDDFTTRTTMVSGMVGAELLTEVEDFITEGAVKVNDLEWQTKNGVIQKARWNVDLSSAKFVVEQLNFIKPKGKDANISGELKNTNEMGFRFREASINADGRLLYEDSEPVQIDFEISGDPHNDFSLKAVQANDMWNVNLVGKKWDASKILAYSLSQTESSPTPNINLVAELSESLKIFENSGLGKVSANLTLKNDSLNGTLVAPQDQLELQLINTEQQRYQLKIADLGGFLKSHNVTEEIEGGKLLFNANQDKKDEPTKGTLMVSKFTMRDIPFFVRLLNVASLNITGLVDDGVQFENLSALLQIQNGKITIQDGVAKGNEILISFDGNLDIIKNSVDVKGNLVPAYAINSILNNVPILGDLLTGDQGGIIAISYSVDGKLDEPNIRSNPISAFTPGLLKRLLGG